MLRHLAPIIIPETIGNPPAPNAAFKAVEELVSAINDSNIKNVAVSADYGAGKSSVVETAIAKIAKDEDIHWWRVKRKRKRTKFLAISLAQLNANVPCTQTKEKQGNSDCIDKDIEYSLLQQLLYYDLPSRTPRSRFYRLRQTRVGCAFLWALLILLAFFHVWPYLSRIHS